MTSDLDQDGVEEVLLAGADQRRNQTVLVELDLKRLAAAGPPRGAEAVIPDYTSGVERSVVFFPHTSLSVALKLDDSVDWMTLADGRITARVSERQPLGHDPFTLYVLNRDLSLLDVTLSNRTRLIWDEAHAQGRVRSLLESEEVARLRAAVTIWKPGGAIPSVPPASAGLPASAVR